MLFVIRFTDKPGSQPIREQYLEAHIAWLDKRRESVLAAGSLRQAPDANPVGAFWVVEAESKRDAADLFKSDPFWTSGMRDNVEIYHWSKAFPDEKALV